MSRGRVLVLMLILVAAGLGADPRFRADDGNFWRLADNPALAAVSGDRFAVGAAVAPDGGLRGRWDRGCRWDR